MVLSFIKINKDKLSQIILSLQQKLLFLGKNFFFGKTTLFGKKYTTFQTISDTYE